jgi:hypothetical protein
VVGEAGGDGSGWCGEEVVEVVRRRWSAQKKDVISIIVRKES